MRPDKQAEPSIASVDRQIFSQYCVVSEGKLETSEIQSQENLDGNYRAHFSYKRSRREFRTNQSGNQGRIERQEGVSSGIGIPLHRTFDFIFGPQVHEGVRASPDRAAADGIRGWEPGYREPSPGNIRKMRREAEIGGGGDGR